MFTLATNSGIDSCIANTYSRLMLAFTSTPIQAKDSIENAMKNDYQQQHQVEDNDGDIISLTLSSLYHHLESYFSVMAMTSSFTQISPPSSLHTSTPSYRYEIALCDGTIALAFFTAFILCTASICLRFLSI